MHNNNINFQNNIDINADNGNGIFLDVKNNIINSVDNIFENNYYNISKFQWYSYLEFDNLFFENVLVEDYKNTILKILLSYQKKWYVIDYIKLPDSLLKENKRWIFNIIYQNFPILWISRLEKWNELLNVNFFWIKELNEIVWKDTVDIFVNWLKDYLITNFDNYYPNGRLIMNSYKNVTFSYDWNNEILNEIFWNIDSNEKLVDYIFDNYLNWLNLTEVQFDNNKKIFQDKFSLWFWNAIIKKDTKFYKLYSYFKSYIWSKKKLDKDKFVLNNIDLSELTEVSHRILHIENILVRDYSNKYIKVNWNNVAVIEYNLWKNKINNKLIWFIRKWWKIDDDKLQELLNLYLKLINENFDFISPLNYFEDTYSRFDEKLLNKWIINTVFFTKNNKWFYNKDYFELIVNWTQWFNCFIDIVDMWVSNINDWLKVAYQIINNYSQKDVILSNILQWWKTWNAKISNLITSINNEFKWAKICIWWDEIFLHFDSSIALKDVLIKLGLMFDKQWLETRLSYWINNEVWYNILDEYTKINKFVKTMIEKNHMNLNVKNLEIYIDPKLNELIMSDMDTFLLNLENDLILNNFKDVLKWNNSKMVISNFELLQRKADDKDIFDKNQYMNCVVSLSKTNMWFKIIIWSYKKELTK